MNTQPPGDVSWYSPTWPRFGIAAGLALIGFLLPQEVPLEWYPLNEPGDDILYLEISCASDKSGDVQIFYNATRGINQLHSIYFPISPTTQTYTYTFPLLDAPIVELRLDPPGDGATFTIRQMRIIDRRGTEIRRFTRDMFRPLNQIAAIDPSVDGWQIVSTPGAIDPYTRLEMFSPILAHDRDFRNLLRSLYSWSYLGLMLWILLMAVLFVFYRPLGWRDLISHLFFYAGIALMFSTVGNRGLIRNSHHFSRYVPPPVPPGLRLEFDLESSAPSPTQIYWDTGRGINGDESSRVDLEGHSGLQTVRFPLPDGRVSAMRFDPRDNPGTLLIRGIRIVDAGQRTRQILPLDSFIAVREVARLELRQNTLVVETVPDASDPILDFNLEAIALINRTTAAAADR